MRILIPVDGTPECEAPIPFARRVANEVEADMYLVRVVEVRNAVSPARIEPRTVQMMQDAEKYLGELASRFELPADHTRRVVSQSKDVAKEISKIAERESIDLIVMASHCKGWLQRLTKGSVYHGVLTSQACPVLSVPVPAQGAERGERAAPALRA
jgi:nucleotide-binding universal stress UspA family protein